MKKKILFISSWFPNKGDLTAGNFVRRHAEAVAGFHNVQILHAAPYDHQEQIYVLEEETLNGIPTLIVYYRNTPFALLNFLRRMIAYHKGFANVQKPDLVHANVLHNSMLYAVYLKYRFSIPFVVTEHWTALRQVNTRRTAWSIRKTAAFIGNRASKLLPVSLDLACGLQNLGITTAMHVVPNVVNTNVFKPKMVSHRPFTFIHVSNLIPRKNPERILKVALELMSRGHDFRLQIGGDGDISKLRQLAGESPFTQNIEIFGTQTETGVADRMRNSDCFILFSDDENQPCVIAESFASGIQVISTNVGGISEFFPDGFGILLECVDEDLLAAAMLKVMRSGEVSGEERAAYAQLNFSAEAIGQKYSEVYHEILR